VVAGSALLVSLLAAWATPAAAAACALSAPAYINVGTQLTVAGTGFPASANVDITITVAGGSPDGFSIQSDAAGAFQIVSTPEALDIGATTVEAAAGSSCTARVTYTVLAAGATPPPATPKPTDESGGGDTGGTGAAPGAPRTDAQGFGSTGAGLGTWALAFALVAIGGASLLLTRSPRRR
jgi:hypothetical protein